MNMHLKLAVLAAAMSLSFAATAGTVDLFTTDQANLSDGLADGIALSSTIGDGTDTTILGGSRDISVSLLTKGTNPFATADIGVAGGILAFSVDAGATGTGTVQWDGFDNSIDLDTTGLNGADLTSDGSTGFLVTTIFSDLGYRFDIEAYTDDNNWTKISFLATEVAVPTSSYIPFDGFTNALLCGYTGDGSAGSSFPGVTSITCGTGTVDWTNLGALQLIIDPLGGTTSVDLILDSVTTIPEPGVLALMGMGLLAAGFAGRRKSKA
ncbi:MAG: PEP-CTERM sorting domain-containing protein [Halopseudomonas sp.]